MRLTALTTRATLALALAASSPTFAAAQTPAPAAGQASPVSPARPAAPSAVTGVAVPTDYVIGPEDVLGVVFWREPEMSGDVAVRPDGRITLPLLGDLPASGVTPEILRDRIQTAAQKYLTDANVTVVVRQLNSRKVFVTGEVRTPAAYPLAGPRTVMQIIALAGGLNEYAKSDKITVIRTEANGQTRSFKFNYKDVSKGRQLQQNIQLLPGDTVVVP